MSIITAEIGYKDTTVAPTVTSTLYVASEPFVTKSTDILNDQYFDGRVDGDFSYRLKLSTAFWGGKTGAGIGGLEVVNSDGALDEWLDYDFRDQAVVIKQHTRGSSYDSATVLLNAVIEKMTVIGEKSLRFVIRDPAAPLIVPMTTDVYSGGTDADGTLVPIAFGKPELVKPVLVDEATLSYEVSDTAIQAVDTVYDQGVSVSFNPTSKGFRLITAPSGKVTCTAITTGTGNDPYLTLSESEYTVSGDGRRLTMDGSLSYGFSDINHSRASSDGGKYYFEMYVHVVGDHNITFTQFVSSSEGAVATGIQSSSISNPQDLKTSGLYCLSVAGRDSPTSPNGVFAYGNGADVDNYTFVGTEDYWYGRTIGVKVDFDSSPMTIEFLDNNTNPDAAFGPHGIPAATYKPVLGVGRLSGDSATIRLIEDDFVYSIPSGYSAWSEGITPDTTFSKLTESISDRLSGVTFDLTSVNTVDGLKHSSPATSYTYSYYLDKPYTASKLLNDAMSGIGGYWFVNRLGKVQVGQLTAPGTSVLTIDDTKITGEINITPDYAPNLSNGLGALRNWSPYRESEVSGSATEVWKQQISRDYQSEYRTTNVMASGYDHADGAELPTSLLSNAAASSQEADRVTALYATERNFYEVPIALNSVDYNDVLDDIGQTYTIESDRFGLSAGLDAVLVGVDCNFLKNELMLRLWGQKPPQPASYVGVSFDTFASEAGTTRSIPAIGDVQEGDLLVCVICNRNSLLDTYPNDDSSWTLQDYYKVDVNGITAPPGNEQIMWWTRTATASEPANYTMDYTDQGTQGMAFMVVAFRNAEIKTDTLQSAGGLHPSQAGRTADEILLCIHGSVFEGHEVTAHPDGMVSLGYERGSTSTCMGGAYEVLTGGDTGTRQWSTPWIDYEWELTMVLGAP